MINKYNLYFEKRILFWQIEIKRGVRSGKGESDVVGRSMTSHVP